MLGHDSQLQLLYFCRECLVNVGDDDESKQQQETTSKEEQSSTAAPADSSQTKPMSQDSMYDETCETIITALCTVGKPCLVEHSYIGAAITNTSSQDLTLVGIGVSIFGTMINRCQVSTDGPMGEPGFQQTRLNIDVETPTSNTADGANDAEAAADGAQTSSSINEASKDVPLRPLLAFFQLENAETYGPRKRLISTPEPYEKWSSTPVKNELKFDDKGGSDYMPINYEPQPTEISFVQCFRLPAPLNNTDMEISAIVPVQ
ncbi:unnamed protein product, partial [Gongylonema pulchrum]